MRVKFSKSYGQFAVGPGFSYLNNPSILVEISPFPSAKGIYNVEENLPGFEYGSVQIDYHFTIQVTEVTYGKIGIASS